MEMSLTKERKNHGFLRTPTPHLFPKQASQSKGAYTAIVHAKQANEHDNHQEKVGDKHGDDGRYIDLDIGYIAWAWYRSPRGVNLWMHQSIYFEIDSSSSPQGYLANTRYFSPSARNVKDRLSATSLV